MQEISRLVARFKHRVLASNLISSSMSSKTRRMACNHFEILYHFEDMEILNMSCECSVFSEVLPNIRHLETGNNDVEACAQKRSPSVECCEGEFLLHLTPRDRNWII